MDFCFRCGKAGDDEGIKLYDSISSEGIVKICEECLKYDNLPIVENASEKINKNTRSLSVHERMMRIADPKRASELNKMLKRDEISLRDIVERNFKEKAIQGKRQPEDLVQNFHWVIMRTRRGRKITQLQLAESISVPEAYIRMVEQGLLPNDYREFIKKIETQLGVPLFKATSIQKERKAEEAKKVRELLFDSEDIKDLTIGDIKGIEFEDGSEKTNSSIPYWKRMWKRKTEKEVKENLKPKEEKEPDFEEAENKKNKDLEEAKEIEEQFSEEELLDVEEGLEELGKITPENSPEEAEANQEKKKGWWKK